MPTPYPEPLKNYLLTNSLRAKTKYDRDGKVSKPFLELLSFCRGISFNCDELESLSFCAFRQCVLYDLEPARCFCGTPTSHGKRKDGTWYSKTCSIKCRSLDSNYKENISKAKLDQYSDPDIKKSIEDKKIQTNRRKLGVDHPMQNVECFRKHLLGSFKAKNGNTLQGYESVALTFLQELYPDIQQGIDFLQDSNNRLSKISWLDGSGKHHTSFPDFHSKLFNGFIEIKSTYTRKVGEYKLMKCRDALRNLSQAYCIITVVPTRNNVSYRIENFNREFIND